MDTVVSCALPVASTTGMSVSVVLPRTAMLVCSSLQTNNQHHWLKERQRGGKERGEKIQGRLVWGVEDWSGCGGLFFFSFSFIFLQHHSWLLPHWWWLVSGEGLYTLEPAGQTGSFPCGIKPPGTQHCPSATTTSLSHPSPIPPWVLIHVSTRVLEESPVVFIDLLLCFQVSTKPVVDTQGMQLIFFWINL